MSFFKKNTDQEDIKKALNKVRARYLACIEDFDTGKELLNEFEDRYYDSLGNIVINMLHFLYQEYLTADAIYKAAELKKNKEFEKEKRIQAVKTRDVAGKLYSEFENRLKKYKPSHYIDEDDEINRLYGAFKHIYDSLWFDAEPILRKKYKTGFKNPVHDISSSIYEFIPRPKETIPHSLFHLKTAIKRNESESLIEKEKNIILKKAAFLLHKIIDTLNEASEDKYFFSSDEIDCLELLREKINEVIYDFRLISFKGRPTSRDKY